MLDDYDYKVENEQLKLKIKTLQSEITQRTRNFMQHNKNKSRLSLAQLSEASIQTEDIVKPKQLHFCKSTDYDKDHQITVVSQKKQLPVDWGSPQKKVNEVQQQSFKSKSNSNQNHITMEDEQQLINGHIWIERKQKLQVKQNQMFHEGQINLKQAKSMQIANKNFSDQFKSEDQQIKQLNQKNQKLKQTLQNIKQQLKKFQVRCQLITKNLLDTEQINYQLRLKNQEYQLNSKKFTAMNDQTIKSYQIKIQQLKSKVFQMEVMKKQYLRAYSKVKQQKEGLQLRVIDLLEQLQRKNNHETSISEPYQSSERHESSHEEVQQIFSQELEQQTRLKTIIQHSEDELIEEMLKKNPSENSISAIKQIIQHGLLEVNRSTSQKWIKSALVKLDQYQSTQNEYHQKMTGSQASFEVNLHEKYKNILINVQKTAARQKLTMQEKFNESMNKLINKFSDQRKLIQLNQNPPKSPTLTSKKTSKVSIQEGVINQMSLVDNIQMQQNKNTNVNQEPEKSNQTLELMIKLNEAHTRYAELKKKYDEISALSNKKENTTQIATLRQQKNYYDIKKFMNKLISMKPVKTNQKLTQQYFDRLSHKVFETLCNLPTGGHGNIYFIPSNQEQLEDALQVIYKFSLQFDQLQQHSRKWFKKQTEGLTKVLQEMVIEGQVPTQKVLQCIHQNIGEENPMSGTIMQSLIKKLSNEANKHKQKQPFGILQECNTDSGHMDATQ